MADAGYDISDYCDIDPLFGSLADIDRLIAEAHSRDIRVLLDFVPNHTSDEHPWFVESRSSRTTPSATGTSGGTSRTTGVPRWCRQRLDLGRAHPAVLPAPVPAKQPDLNWRNPEVVAAMHDVLRFWLDRGIDGFRIDVIHCTGKDPSFADDPRCRAGQPLSDFNDQPYSHEVLRGLRKLVDSYPGDRMLVGEVNIRSTERVLQYYGAGDELHSPSTSIHSMRPGTRCCFAPASVRSSTGCSRPAPADLGAVQPRQCAPAQPLPRLRARCPRCRGAVADAARHAVHLPGRGTGHGRRTSPTRRASTGRPRRLSCSHSLAGRTAP